MAHGAGEGDAYHAVAQVDAHDHHRHVHRDAVPFLGHTVARSVEAQAPAAGPNASTARQRQCDSKSPCHCVYTRFTHALRRPLQGRA
jgi:hypothetical protein